MLDIPPGELWSSFQEKRHNACCKRSCCWCPYIWSIRVFGWTYSYETNHFMLNTQNNKTHIRQPPFPLFFLYEFLLQRPAQKCLEVDHSWLLYCYSMSNFFTPCFVQTNQSMLPYPLTAIQYSILIQLLFPNPQIHSTSYDLARPVWLTVHPPPTSVVAIFWSVYAPELKALTGVSLQSTCRSVILNVVFTWRWMSVWMGKTPRTRWRLLAGWQNSRSKWTCWRWQWSCYWWPSLNLDEYPSQLQSSPWLPPLPLAHT